MTKEARKLGFTLIELLVVIVIVGILAGTLVPVIGRALGFGDDAVARNNLRNLGQAALAYRQEHGAWPAAGGVFTEFTTYVSGSPEKRYGRSRGWVYFEHDCPRASDPNGDKVGDGNHQDGGDLAGVGMVDANGDTQGDEVNEAGVCLCFDSTREEGGLNAVPAAWADRSGSGDFSDGEVAIMNGALFEYVGENLTVFSNPAFAERAVELRRVDSREAVVRAYAMNVVTGADEDLYKDEYYQDAAYEQRYCCGVVHNALRLGSAALRPRTGEGDNERAEASPANTVLFVELDLDEERVSKQNGLAGDQVWDWDEQDECMGFNHDDGGAWVAFVCFGDGRVDAIRDPSSDSDSPDTGKREKVSKYYGSGGMNRNGSPDGN